MKFIWKGIKLCLVAVILLSTVLGFYAAHIAYDRLFHAPWDRILGIADNRGRLSAIHEEERRNGWQPVTIRSKDGTELHGTYIEDSRREADTVILLHGLYQNRSMMLPYAEIYRNMGFHVLMIDLRGHGESGGDQTSWGIHETDDIDAWRSWIHERTPASKEGIHGVSLGAALALIYGGTEKGKEVAFYVADSSYGNLMKLGEDKLSAFTGDPMLVDMMDLLYPFFQVTLYGNEGKWLSDIDPLDSAKKMTSPVLFLHGEKDSLVPAKVAEELFDAAGSRNKRLVLFPEAGHTMELGTDRSAYVEAVQNFIASTG